VAFSPDSRRLATSGDQTARVWDAESGKPLAVLHGHSFRVLSVAFSPDGRRLATSSRDKTARLWDAESGEQLAVLQGHTEIVVDASFSPDGRRIATASWDQTVRLWDAGSGELLAVLQGHTGSIECVAFSPDGRRIATAGASDNTARLWDVESGRPLAVLQGHAGEVRSVSFSPDGRRIATASADATARLWIARESPEELEKRLAEQRRLDREQQDLWHTKQAADAERSGQWFAAAFHLGRLIDADPASPSLYARRGAAYALQGQWDKAAADLLQGAALCKPANEPQP
jgi:WD40 repeat protein